MSSIQNAIKELSTALEENELPRDFLESYDQLECLSHNHGTETYLVQQKGSQALCIAKCYDRKIYKSVNESGILKALCHDGLPAFMDEYQNDAAVCIVREYVEGIPLDKYITEHDLSEAQIVALCVKLCDILIYLHGQQPPIIHRDIKPQNIVVKENGNIALIDFDIARTYDKGAQTDTQFIGTRTYAPPEQYGFSQTDCRADIYSLGVLLCFLLTGNTDVKNTEIANKRLAVIVRRCAAFSPEERFSDAATVRKALVYTGGCRQKKIAHLFGAIALVLISLCAGFVIGRYTSILTPYVFAKGVQFTEPLIEQAVRIQLGKDETESITEEDLLSVREIYIFGNEVSKTEEAFFDGLGGQLRDTPRGSLTSLEDVKLLPNLEILYVNYQTLTDITPVSELEHLTTVHLRHTFVEDISALSNMKQLSSVILYDTNVADMSALSSCSALSTLDAGETLITSLDTLPEHAGLKVLSIKRMALTSLDGIERFLHLEQLDLSFTEIEDLTPLAALPRLSVVTVDESMREAVSSLGNSSIEIRYN
jgi:serine/threonine protein kinase